MASETTSDCFWGLTLHEGKQYSQSLERPVHLSMAALDPSSNQEGDGPVSVMFKHKDSAFMICSLKSNHTLQQSVDLNFDGGDLTFFLQGKGTVHLTGYLMDNEEYTMEDDSDDDDDEDFIPTESLNVTQSEISTDDDLSDVDSDDDESVGYNHLPGALKRKLNNLKKKNAKKPKVEIVDKDSEDDSDLSSTDVSESDISYDDDEEESANRYSLIDDEAEEDLAYHESSDVDSDDDGEDNSSEEEIVVKAKEKEVEKKKSKKNKKKKNKILDESKSSMASADDSMALSTTPQKETSADPETVEKKKKKKKNKNKKADSIENAAAEQDSNKLVIDKDSSSKAGKKVVEGVTIEDVKMGHGPEATTGKTVCVNFTAKLQNGKVVDSNSSKDGKKISIGKKEVIKGWEIGLQGMKVGGKRKLIIPPKMGFGNVASGAVPPNSILFYEMELKRVL